MTIEVELLYAPGPERQELRVLSLAEGATAFDALRASGLFELFPELNRDDLQLGIHARVVERETVLKQGDRVEVYRPLQADPKEARRARAAARKAKPDGA